VSSIYYTVIYTSTRDSAHFIIIQIGVIQRKVFLEVYSRRAAVAYIGIHLDTTRAVLNSIVSQTRALAGYHVAALSDFQIILTSRVKINTIRKSAA
jgi:hypothetical protein